MIITFIIKQLLKQKKQIDSPLFNIEIKSTDQSLQQYIGEYMELPRDTVWCTKHKQAKKQTNNCAF